jgi:GntP family gluconate:H+ symporter
VGIPIFCDSGFIILHGLVGPLAAGAGLSRLSLSTGLAGGLYVTHCLLPPHPGATAGAATLGLKENLGLVMMLGFALALPLTLVAHWGSRRLKDATGLHREETSLQPIATTQKLPSLWLSILPILAPLFLLGLGAAMPLSASPPWMQLLGSPVMALGTGFLLSLVCLHGRAGKMETSQWFNQSVLHAGGIVVIVGAGGMLGEAIKHTSISQLLGQWLQQGQFSALAFLCIAWLVAVVLKTAQGSTTSAIIVVTAMLAPLLGPAGMAAPLPAALVLLSVCTGTMMVSHANDAYFWVITEFAQLPMKQGFRGFTRLSVLLGLSGLAIVLLLGAVLL